MEYVKDASFYQLMGEDSVRFLNNYFSADLMGWDKTQPIEGLLLDVKGRVITLLTVFTIDGGLGLLSWGSPIVSIVDHLDRYLFKNDKSIAADPGRGLFFEADDAPPSHWLPRGPMVSAASKQGEDWKLALTMGGACWLRAADNDLTSGPPANEFHQRRVRFGFPWISQDTLESTLPQELDRDAWDISFTKGCYLGQETVARLDARGHVNWILRGVEFQWQDDQEPEWNPALKWQLHVDDQRVGTVTSVASGGGLVRIRANQAQPDTILDVLANEHLVAKCRVIEFPKAELPG